MELNRTGFNDLVEELMRLRKEAKSSGYFSYYRGVTEKTLMHKILPLEADSGYIDVRDFYNMLGEELKRYEHIENLVMSISNDYDGCEDSKFELIELKVESDEVYEKRLRDEIERVKKYLIQIEEKQEDIDKREYERLKAKFEGKK